MIVVGSEAKVDNQNVAQQTETDLITKRQAQSSSLPELSSRYIPSSVRHLCLFYVLPAAPPPPPALPELAVEEDAAVPLLELKTVEYAIQNGNDVSVAIARPC